MKKGLKITFITLGSLLGLVIIALVFALWSLLSPARLTKLVNKEAPNFLNCKFHIEKVDLTFFKTFPHIGLDLHELVLINPVYGAPTDTLLHVKHCATSLNIRELVKDKHVAIRDFTLQNGTANLFANPVGQTNFTNILRLPKDTTSSEFSYTINLEQVKADNIHVSYIDLQSKRRARLNDLDLIVKGTYDNNDMEGDVKLGAKTLSFVTLDDNPLLAKGHDLDLHFDGSLLQMDSLLGTLNINIADLVLHVGDDPYVDTLDVTLASDLKVGLSNQTIDLRETALSLGDYKLAVEGNARRDTATGDLSMNLNYRTETWPLQEVLDLLPRALVGSALDSLHIDGRAGLAGTVMGHYNEHLSPFITSDITLDDGTFSMEGFPLVFDRIHTLCHVDMDLNNETNVTIKELDAYNGRNHITAQGTVKDLLGKMLCDLAINGDLHVQDYKDFLPSKLTRCNARAKADIKTVFDHNQITSGAYSKINATGKLLFSDVDVLYDDSLALKSPSMDVAIEFPVKEQPYKIGEWAHIHLKAPHLSGSKVGVGNLEASTADIDAYVNNLLDSTLALKLGTHYQFQTVNGQMDTLLATMQNSTGTFVMRDNNKLSLQYAGDGIAATVGKTVAARTGKISFTANSHYNEHGKNMLMRWNPDVKLKLAQGNASFQKMEMPLEIPSLDIDFTLKHSNIHNSRVKMGSSECHLSGEINNIDKYYENRGLLTANLDLTSDYLDLNQIMDLLSGLNAPDSLLAEKPENSESDPFMVPYGINLHVKTTIKKALFEEAEIRNVGGYISIKDGQLVLDQMGLTSDAARMQLTALYKSPRKNHLFLGLDFHLLDIKIDKLIAMIPEVDTILPMLKSFAGNAEFHFAVETYLKSNYDLKYSTLRGAAAINGHNLVVLDNETYQNISKKLRFNKKTENRIDSLSAEATIFKNEIDVYPFAVSIDKYQAILSGRHNLDMTYNYNISLLKPIRLGLDIIGTDKLKFKVGKAKYADFYKPERQNVVEKNVMQLKQQINQALRSNVREQ